MKIRGLWILAVLIVLAMGSDFGASRAAAESCANEAARAEQGSAELPDCRAYELASSADSNGHPIEPLNSFALGAPYDLFPTELGSPTGDSLVYLTYSSPLASPTGAAGIFDVYVAERSADGWATDRRLSASGTQAPRLIVAPAGVSPDHDFAFANNQRDNLVNPGGFLELTGIGTLGEEPYAQGRYITAAGGHVIFTTGHNVAQSRWCFFAGGSCQVQQLEPDAPPSGTGAIYDRSADGPTHVVSLLPGNKPLAAGEEPFYAGVSADGRVIAFTVEGTLYVRIEGKETKEVAAGDPTFAGLSSDGRYVFYVVSGKIHRFDTGSAADIVINSAGEGEIVNVSSDGSHVYFISEQLLDGPSNGTDGQPNMYVWRGGAPKYVTTVAPGDLERTSGSLAGLPALTNWTGWVANAPKNGGDQGPGADSSRTTPDGKVLVFESRAQLTSYENAEHTEVYRYEEDDSGAGIICVSCNFASAASGDGARLEEVGLLGAPMIVHNVSEDGSRVFFESDEALASRDTDGVNDIYEWHEEFGGTAEVDLISSGASTRYPLPEDAFLSPVFAPLPNVLISVTPSGNDAFFLSQDTLVPEAPEGGATVVYDARVGGGFLQPHSPEACSEEGCRSAIGGSSPSFSKPPSETAAGPGNLKPRKHQCRRGKRKKHKKPCMGHHHHRSAARSGVAPGQTESAPTAVGGEGETTAVRAATASDQNSGGPVALGAEGQEYGIQSVAAEESTTAAGRPTDFTSRLKLNYHLNGGRPESEARTENVSVYLPPGLLGNPNAVPRCKTGQLVAFGNCPVESQVGIVRLALESFGKPIEPVYNMEVPHPDREIARLGFVGTIYPVFIDVRVRTAGDYGVTATVQGGPGLASLLEANTTLWGNPSDPVHAPQRFTANEEIKCGELGESEVACLQPGKKREVDLPSIAFMANPSACQQGDVGFEVTSYQLPGQIFTASAPLAPITECRGLSFAPTFEAEPTSHQAGAPTGLRTKVALPQHLGGDERATATIREVRVTLPEGMQIAAGAANWIGTCSEAQVGFHREIDTACPDASRLGTATILSPALPEPIQGALYQRDPSPGHPFGLWLTADTLGLHIKLPGELQPDRRTGRLTAVFHDLPQVPVEEIDLNVWGGPRAPLQNPSVCGTYVADFSFAPHSEDPLASGADQMVITEGCDRSFDPKLSAGVTRPVAGRYSPLIVDLSRENGEQDLRGLELELPNGELAKLKGVPLCPDGVASSGACPAESAIGHLVAATGPGPEPLWLPQPGRAEPKVYLAGPHDGFPFSVISVVPAQAGPFDLGDVVVRSGLGLDPDTNRAVVQADPLPQFFEGVGLTYRRLHVLVDRPGFSLNPTDCRAMRFDSTVSSVQGAVAHPSSRFKVDGCKRLKFRPGFSLELAGGTARGDYPALTAVLQARRGDANIARASVALPHSEFLAQEHIRAICTRIQFVARKCPKGSIYGRAKAYTPLLAKPLEGPVYLRSSDNPLPDLVARLGGELDVNLVGRIDSDKAGGIRTTFDAVPDAPVTKFVLKMRGSKKALLTNSVDLCNRVHRANVRIAAQNGRRFNSWTRLGAKGCH